MNFEKSLRAAYFLGALGAWVRQLEEMDFTYEITSILKFGIDEALAELRGGKIDG